MERDYAAEKRLAAREFEEKKKELKENLLIELEEKKKIIEQERYTLELTGDSMEVRRSTSRNISHLPNPLLTDSLTLFLSPSLLPQ